jgi:membrane protein implicated in regulation of membrane protease activity
MKYSQAMALAMSVAMVALAVALVAGAIAGIAFYQANTNKNDNDALQQEVNQLQGDLTVLSTRFEVLNSAVFVNSNDQVECTKDFVLS